jgi:predicted transcriptional regulator
MAVAELKEKIRERNLTNEKLADAIGMDVSTLYRKMAGDGEGFTVREVTGIIDTLNLSDEEALHIFFRKRLA